jgi:hypothetical protein
VCFRPAVIGVLSVMLTLAACTHGAPPFPPELRVDDVSVVVSSESELLSRPVDMLLDESGRLWVLDYLAAQVLVMSADGELLQTFGREGSGPREFQRPSAFALSADTLRVVDTGNGRVQTLALGSDFTRSAALPGVSSMGPVAVRGDGRFLITTLGMFDALAAYYDPTGEQIGTLGTPFGSVSLVMSPSETKQEIVDGKVPAMFRNSVLPLLAPDGDMWLVLTGEGLLQRFDEAGSLQVSVPLEAPEMEQVWQEVVEHAESTLANPRSVKGLFYVWDAAVVGRTLWLLLNTTERGPAVLMAFTAEGQGKRRVLFPEIRGARQLALDPARGRVFFAITSDASIVASSLPDSIFDEGT